MRLAQIVDQKGGKLPIPEAFRRMLGPLERSHQSASVFCVHLCSSGQPLITTIPPRSWLTVLRMSVLLEHKVGQLSAISEILSDLGINILLMEGYGYHPAEEGWWSAVIDFPALHRRLPRESEAKLRAIDEIEEGLKVKVRELLGRLFKLSEGSGGVSCPVDESTDIGGFILRKDDGFLVKIESMKLRRLAPDLQEDPDNVQPQRVVRNSIRFPSDAGHAARRVRKLMLCNTEERFIRLVDTNDLAEIDLKVHTGAQGDVKEGVGVLATVTKILKDFEPKNEHGKPMFNDKGVNIAFTYNYIMTDYESRNVPSGTSETSVVKMFLESPPPIAKLASREQCRIWGDLFGKLLDARRNPGEQPFVKAKGSSMTIWHRKKRTFKVDRNRRVREAGLIPRLVDQFSSPEKAEEATTLGWSVPFMLVFAWLGIFGDLFINLATAFAGVAISSFYRLFSSRFKH